MIYLAPDLSVSPFQVPVTNFFGSVMETIHTDSPYRSIRRQNTDAVRIKTSPDQSNNDERRSLSNTEHQNSVSDAEVMP